MGFDPQSFNNCKVITLQLTFHTFPSYSFSNSPPLSTTFVYSWVPSNNHVTKSLIHPCSHNITSTFTTNESPYTINQSINQINQSNKIFSTTLPKNTNQ